MSEPSLAIGIATTIFTVSIGLALYFLRKPIRIMRIQNQILGELITKEKELSKLDEDIYKKTTTLNNISKETKKAEKGVKQINEVKKLRKALEEEQSKNQKLEKKIKSLEDKAKKPLKVKQPVKKYTTPIPKADDNDGTEKIKQKYPALPKNQLERIEIERSVARSLMKKNNGSFHISQILRTIEGLYSNHIKPNDRIMLLNEIKSWIERDPLCKGVKTTDKVQHYTFI